MRRWLRRDKRYTREDVSAAVQTAIESMGEAFFEAAHRAAQKTFPPADYKRFAEALDFELGQSGAKTKADREAWD